MMKYIDRLFWLMIGFLFGAVTGATGIAILSIKEWSKPTTRPRYDATRRS